MDILVRMLVWLLGLDKLSNMILWISFLILLAFGVSVYLWDWTESKFNPIGREQSENSTPAISTSTQEALRFLKCPDDVLLAEHEIILLKEKLMEYNETIERTMRQIKEKDLELAYMYEIAGMAESRAITLEASLSNCQQEIESLSEHTVCGICVENDKDVAFDCGHMACQQCAPILSTCHVCRHQILMRLKLYHG